MPLLFHVLCHHASAPFSNVSTYVLREAHLVAFDIPQQIQIQVGFGFPNCMMGSVAVFLPGYLLSVPASTFCMLSSCVLSFTRSNLFIHAGFLEFLLDFLLMGMDCPWA